jgi:transposase
VQKHDRYLGRRVKRGLLKSKNGYLINADINGSLNIIRKAISNFTISKNESSPIINYFVIGIKLSL